MGYLRIYKKKKQRYFVKKILPLSIIILAFYLFIYNEPMQSEMEDNKTNIKEEQMIQSEVNNVVGITKNNVYITDNYTQWGSGIIISSDGYILTNEHVSGRKYENCYVIIDDDKKYKANIIWSNSELDLSILKIDATFDNYALLGDSDDLNLGENIYSIGNPLGISFEKTITFGIISGLNRNLEFEENGQKIYINNLIQIDCGINPGNSGGALINCRGELIGITTVKISSAEAMAFAIPINIVKPVIKKIKDTGTFIEPTIGIWGYDKYSIKEVRPDVKIKEGIYVAQINANSTSELSGLKVGDIILEIDGEKLEKVTDLQKNIYEKNVGDIITLNIERTKKNKKIEIKLSKK